MKYRLLIVVVILYLLTALPTSAQTTSTLTPTASGSYVTAPDIYVRGGPGSAYLPVGRLVAGDPVIPLNHSVNGIWVMIQYNRGYGWVRRDLAAWIEDIDALPTLDETHLTPTALVSETPTAAPTGIQVNAGAEGAFVRFGPGLNYPFLGAIVTGDYVEPVGRNVEGDWLLIRFRGGFGWIARNLVNGTVELNRLPVLLPDALTPSVTFTASATPRFTATATSSATPTATPTLIPTNTPLPATTAVPLNTAIPSPPPSSTATPTPTETFTLTNTPSSTATATSSATLTPTHTSTPTPTFTASYVPTRTASSTLTDTPVPTDTPVDTATPSASATSTPTHTASPTMTFTPTQTATMTFTPSPPPTEVVAQIVASDTPPPTDTPLPPSSTPTDTSTDTNTPSPTSTATPSPTATPSSVAAAVAPPTPVPAETPAPETPDIPPEVIVGAALFVLVVGYVALYWRALTVGERYAEGFVIERCPVCQQGHLTVERRPARVLGIPRPQAIVRCDNCRSVLREVGRRRWRYAVDRAANLTLYNQLNGRIINEDTLRALEESAPREAPPVRPPARPPTFVDDEE